VKTLSAVSLGSEYNIPFNAFVQYGTTFSSNKVDGKLNFVHHSSVQPVLSTAADVFTTFGIKPKITAELTKIVSLFIEFTPNLTIQANQNSSPFSGRSTYPNPNAKVKYGDCTKRHYVEYNISGNLESVIGSNVEIASSYSKSITLPLVSLDLVTGCAFTIPDSITITATLYITLLDLNFSADEVAYYFMQDLTLIMGINPLNLAIAITSNSNTLTADITFYNFEQYSSAQLATAFRQLRSNPYSAIYNKSKIISKYLRFL